MPSQYQCQMYLNIAPGYSFSCFTSVSQYQVLYDVKILYHTEEGKDV